MKFEYLKIMLNIFLIGSLLNFVISCSDSDSIFDNKENKVKNTDYSASQAFSQNVAVNNQTKFILNAVNGSVKIGITDGQLVTISGLKIVESESVDDAQNYLKNISVPIDDRGDEVFAETRQPEKNYGRNLIVNYNVFIPKNWLVNIVNVNGDVTLDSLEGDLLVSLVNGPVNLNKISASVTIDVINGSINGDMTLPMEETCNMSLVNGSINLAIPVTTSADFSARVTNGSINLLNLVLQNLQSSTKVVAGTLGTGQGNIDLETENGIINVTGY